MPRPHRSREQTLPAHIVAIVDAAVRRRAGKEPCAPDDLGIWDQRYARRPLDGSAGYHLWSPTRGLGYYCRHARDDFLPYRQDEELGPPMAAVHVPPEQRCGGWVAHRYLPRPWIGPLPEQWPEARIPIWYAWWRLHDIQDGTCATCSAPAYAFDHDHHTGPIRGLLCVSCNKREGTCRRLAQDGTHPGTPCFQAYWDDPPAAPLRWMYGKPSLSAA